MRSVAVFVLIALSLEAFLPLTVARAVEPAPPPGKDLVVYHIGNSLTRCIPLERLAELFEAAGGRYDYGMQLGGGHRLEQHLSMRNHGNKPGEGRYNTVEPYGTWDHAFKNYRFDAVILQPYKGKLDQEPHVVDHWPWFTAGDLQAASGLIDYARARTRPGEGRWDREHANTTNVAADRFYIYATWPGAGEILEQDGEPTYASYWDDAYGGEVQACRDFYDRLVRRLNEHHPDLPVPVRMIPVGDVLARLDEKIRSGRLPGIESFYARNQKYFIKSRRNNKNPSPFGPGQFARRAGVLNFYADGIHMNDQPHNGRDSGTIGSYVSALTHYATLTGESPLGLTTGPYEQFDPQKDAELIRALQEAVWEVVSTHPHTGVCGHGG
ncbi:MAG: hypothetical protein PVJ27_05725 [Candidatus Brocadiaceae bacterium]